MRKHLPMAAWFDPRLLIKTGIRALISTVFGQFADKREAIAAANAIQATPKDGEFNYAATHGGGDFWFDYLADTGDGWNSTFAMASLVAEDSLPLGKDGEALKRGRVLILGGDQVYPTATKEEYRDRFIGPFDEAYEPGGEANRRWPDEAGARPDLYAIPGNHDWYDGLNSFFGLFCRRRIARPGIDLGVSRNGKVIGGRQTRQTRSYFAIELPENWWVWGTDSQLEGYIDQPQIDYFQHAATYWMEPGAKVILCVADPSWAYVNPKHPDRKFESFSYLERLAGSAQAPLTPKTPPGEEPPPPGRWPEPGTPMGHELKLVLTGDSHHYCRFKEDDRNYIVCGGGGAFLHPTHHIKDKSFNYRFPKPGADAIGDAAPATPHESEHKYPRSFKVARDAEGKEALFPSRNSSRRLAFGNLKFVLLNKAFVAVFVLAYALFNWALDFNARIATAGTLTQALRGGDWATSLETYWFLVLASPWSFLLVALAGLGYYYFADSPYSAGLRAVLGLLHGLVQAAVVTVTTCTVVRCAEGLISPDSVHWDNFVSVALATLASALASGIAFGLYLLASLNLLGRHPNEGFSSLRIEGYKSFLRLRLKSDGELEIYPIGLEKVGRDGKPHLIEGPIVVK